MLHAFSSTMAPTNHPRKPRYLHNIFYLLVLLLTYILLLLLAHRTPSVPVHEEVIVRPRQGSAHGNNDALLFTATTDETILDTVETEQPKRPVLYKFPDPSEISLQPSPGIVWLMSFGGSGTSYTITNVETATGTTTATNYAENFDECVGILPRGNPKLSPCLHKPDKSRLPGSYILTKTHCGGYCMDCAPNEYVHTIDSFETACRTAKLKRSDGIVEEFTYDTALVERAIHMIRNPFDNLVGRMHLGRKRRQQRGQDTDSFVDTPEGIAAWCRQLDQHILERERKSPLIPDEFFEKYSQVPCHVEWFRLAQWHTRTVQVTERLGLPVHQLYYENYTSNFDATTSELFDFLQLDTNNPPYPFRPGKTYAHMFDKDYVETAANLVKDIASTKVWNLVKHYFQTPDDDGGGGETTKALYMEESDDFPTIGLLMSFPNSGTSYTITNTEKVSQRTTASNYGVGLYTHDRLPNGPYLHKEQMELPSPFLLTKTHCMGYCDDCHPKNFVIGSTDNFWKGCLSGEQMVHGNRTRFTYDASLVTRAIHLFRSPFDNLIARMHLAVKRRRDVLGWKEDELENFAHSREGHLKWCDYIDTRHGGAFFKASYVSDDVKALMEQVPCALDWYRWVEWHNHAIEATKTRGLPVHYLYYEQYSTAYNKTLGDLLDFLEMPTIAEPLAFHSGKTYRDLYTDEEILMATRLARTLASPACWDLIRHYFEDDEAYAVK